MAHRVAAWERMPWEAVEAVAVPSVEKGRATCVQDEPLLRPVTCRTSPFFEPLLQYPRDSPPLVESRPVTGPQPLYQPQGVP